MFKINQSINKLYLISNLQCSTQVLMKSTQDLKRTNFVNVDQSWTCFTENADAWKLCSEFAAFIHMLHNKRSSEFNDEKRATRI